MKRLAIIPVLLLAVLVANAQFNQVASVEWPDTLQLRSVEWVDIDNDSLLDIIAFADQPSGYTVAAMLANHTSNQFEFAGLLDLGVQASSFSLNDVNHDNRIDLIVSGTSSGEGLTQVFPNNGSFTFGSPSGMLTERFGLLHFQDLNADGTDELIVGGSSIDGNFVKFFESKDTQWFPVYDTLEIQVVSLSTADYNGDMMIDVFFHGLDDTNAGLGVYLFNRRDTLGNIHWRIDTLGIGEENTYVYSDFNSNGIPDILQFREGSTQQVLTEIVNDLRNSTDTTLTGVYPDHAFAADLDSDGLVDLSRWSVNGTGIIQFSSGNSVDISRTSLVDQAFGDWDRDGDLDLVQATQNSFYFLINEQPEKNLEPLKSNRATGLTFYSKLFLYWDRGSDDHTDSKALTFDVNIQSNLGTDIAADFDLFNYRRLLVKAGNGGSHNFLLLSQPSGAAFNFMIQSVDNSFHAGAPFSGTCVPCSGELEIEDVVACGPEEQLLSEQEEVLWFSFREGFLGQMESLNLSGFERGTIFSFNPNSAAGCGAIKVYNYRMVEGLVKTEQAEKHACLGEEVEFEVEDGWESVSWSSAVHGFLSNENSIEYTVSGKDTVIVMLLENETKCLIERRTAILPHEVQVTPEAIAYQILKGDEVQLSVAGGVGYQWAPSTGLSNPQIANPVASPTTTIRYEVTVTDTLGCIGKGEVMIIVESTAFVATLFTPNGDGNNDALKIYGLGQVDDFSFTIYNREGSRVYTSNSANEVTQDGWNGKVGGVLQPAGVYTRKVGGKQPNGRPALLNGKQSGSVVLVR